MIKKLVDKIVETNAPIVVGLDPMMKYLPKHLADVAFEQYGETLGRLFFLGRKRKYCI